MSAKKVMSETGNDMSRLRNIAEMKLGECPALSSKINDKTPEEIIHELEVNQIELEMQNEELKRVQADLQESRDKYEDLYDFAPIGYLTLTHKGTIEEVNLTGAPTGNASSKIDRERFWTFCRSREPGPVGSPYQDVS